MIKQTKLIFLFIIVLLISSCSPPGLSLPTWLEGEWETGQTDGFAGETWTIVNDTLMSGQGLVFTHGIERVIEEISIFISQGEMYYGARVTDQNNEKEILFKATLINEGHMVFENPEHDFPTRIVYKLKAKNSLDINISGRDEEDSRTIELHKK